MFFFTPIDPRHRKVMERVEEFRATYPSGADLKDFVEMVLVAVKDPGMGLTSSGGPGVVSIDARTTRNEISDRTVRYYRTKGWIADPYRDKGRGARYHEIHFLQMLAAYKLRLSRSPMEAAIGKVAKMTFDECLETITGRGKDVAMGSAWEEAEPCDVFRVLLVAERQNPEARRVAKLVHALARRNGGSRLLVRIHDAEIELVDAAKREFPDNEVSTQTTDSEDGDGRIRSQIRELRTQHGIDRNDFVQIVTTRTHKWDWFADWGATNPRDGVLHVGDYEREFGISKEAVTASYSLLLAFCGELAGRGVSPYGLFHRDHSRGCLFDFCDEKRDVVLKLLSGDICHDCLQRLRPLFGKGLMREVASFLDAIRGRVRALGQYVAEAEEKLREILRRVFVHALIDGNVRGQMGAESLPQDGDDLQMWVFESGVGVSLGIARELDALRALVGKRAANGEVDENAWSHSRGAIIETLRHLHPDLQFVRIDSVQLKSGALIAEGASLPECQGEDCQADSWQFSFDGDLASLGITDSGATYARIVQEGTGPRFVKIDTHLRVEEVGGRSRAVLRLPDGTLVDYADGTPLRGCTAFSVECGGISPS
jgi:hypothetical protein